MEEIYKVIKGFENYSVSNLGNVRNDKKDKILKQSLTKTGYKKVNLNNGKTIRVHRLVAEAFIPNPDNKPCVDHIDNNRTNNNVNNLRFVSYQENNFNTSITNKNTTGHKGIRWNKHRNKYEAFITLDNKKYNLGLFEKLEDAVKVRQEKANELFKEYTHSSERIVNVNITIPKNTKLNINVNVKDDDDEELRLLEQEFLEKCK
jgi:hypothetical protein